MFRRIHGGWSLWSSWAGCSATCGTGSWSRSRSCDNPAPVNGGEVCRGNTTETSTCTLSGCPVNGSWTTWGAWSSCDVTCTGGTSFRTRSCSDPPASSGGLDCMGDHNESTSCNSQNCPIDGSFDDWTQWTTCPVTCGGGSVSRSRSCTNPRPQFGGSNCTGVYDESSACSTTACPVDGNWGLWASSSCSANCGYGKQSKMRYCDAPLPAYGGSNCTGSDAITEQCVETMCTGIRPDDYVNQCGDGMFTCHSGQILCIDKDFRCECENDCDDGSDEAVIWAGCDAAQAALCSSADGVYCCGDFFHLAVSLFVLVVQTL